MPLIGAKSTRFFISKSHSTSSRDSAIPAKTRLYCNFFSSLKLQVVLEQHQTSLKKYFVNYLNLVLILPVYYYYFVCYSINGKLSVTIK